jgi:hypothetical protein
VATLLDGRWGKISSVWELPCGLRVEVYATDRWLSLAGPEWRRVCAWDGSTGRDVLDPLSVDMGPAHPCYDMAGAVLDRRAPVEAILDALAELGELSI